jgi:hypothetical protein
MQRRGRFSIRRGLYKCPSTFRFLGIVSEWVTLAMAAMYKLKVKL